MKIMVVDTVFDFWTEKDIHIKLKLFGVRCQFVNCVVIQRVMRMKCVLRKGNLVGGFIINHNINNNTSIIISNSTNVGVTQGEWIN